MIAACAALASAGVVMVVRWGGAVPAWGRREAVVALAAGLAAGVLAAGAGGRLVMRLLAITSPDAAGSFTEAAEVVGEISVEGTLAFLVFTGVPAGLLSGVAYALVRPLLPAGRAGGAALGALLLVVAGTRVDPLRPDNIDFRIVGPAWLAVLAFSALALFQGMLVAAIAARLSPGQVRPPGRRFVTAGRVVLALIVLAALPGVIVGLADILG